MASTTSDPVTEDDIAAGQPRRLPLTLLLLVTSIIGILAALAVPFAPVVAEETTVTWPNAGQPAESTTAFFVPYEPANVHVQAPCSVLRAGEARPTATTIVSSHLPGHANKGFAVTTVRDHVIVLLGGQEVFRGPIPAGECGLAIDAGAADARVRLGDRVVAVSPQYVKQIFAFTTELTPRETGGLKVEARTSNWFQNTPAATKTLLMSVQLGLSAFALALLALIDWRRGVTFTALRIRWRIRYAADLAMLGVLGLWAVLGPMTPDDGFAAMTIRNGSLNGDVGNYYRWENSSESPFTLFQRMLVPVLEWNPNPLAMRLPSLAAALLTWLLLSRIVLPAVLPAYARSLAVRALAAVALLSWWLPFGLGVRPEPFAAAGITTVLACVLRGITRESGIRWLGLAAVATGLTLAISPVGITAAAPIIVAAPQIFRTLRVPGASSARTAGLIAALACLVSVGLVAMFADQSWFGVRMSNELHGFYGPNVPWYSEVSRYGLLLGFNFEGTAARRLPVLVTIAVVTAAVLLLSRGARRLPGMRLAYVPPVTLAVSLLLLWLTPSKWTHYFGSLSGLGAAALTCSVVLVISSAQRWGSQRPVVLIGLAGTALTVVAGSLSFAGKNNWFLYSQFGVPWDDGPVRPLNTPGPWIALVFLLLALALLRGRVERMVVLLPAVLGSLMIVLSVAMLVFSFGVAPWRQAGSYSVGGQNLATLQGGSCGIADKIVVTDDERATVARPAEGADQAVGFAPGTGYAQGTDPGIGADFQWGSLGGGPVSTGWLTSRWFELPHVGQHQELAISAAGRTGDGNRLAVEFGRSQAGGNPQMLGEHVLDDAYKDPDERPTYPQEHVIEDLPQDNPSWRPFYVDAAAIPPGADRVRVRAVDATTDSGGWLAVTGPRIRPVVLLKDFLDHRAPVYVDWSMTWVAPCVRTYPRVGSGLAEEPATLLKAPASLGFSGEAPFAQGIGGSFTGVLEMASLREIPTRLLGAEDKPQYADWGHLLLADYPLRTSAYDVRTTPRPQWGWEGQKDHPKPTVP